MTQSIKMLASQGKMTAGDTFKMGLGLIFGLAADAAVSAALGGLMPAGKGWKHLLRIGGVFVLAMMAGEKAEGYVCTVFEDAKNAIMEARKEMQPEVVEETKE